MTASRTFAMHPGRRSSSQIYCERGTLDTALCWYFYWQTACTRHALSTPPAPLRMLKNKQVRIRMSALCSYAFQWFLMLFPFFAFIPYAFQRFTNASPVLFEWISYAFHMIPLWGFYFQLPKRVMIPHTLPLLFK